MKLPPVWASKCSTPLKAKPSASTHPSGRFKGRGVIGLPGPSFLVGTLPGKVVIGIAPGLDTTQAAYTYTTYDVVMLAVYTVPFHG